MKRAYIIAGTSVVTLAIVAGSVFLFRGNSMSEIPFAQMSEIKTNAAKFGRLLGAMRACEGLPDPMQVSLDEFKKIDSGDLKTYVIKKLEKSEIAYSDLEKIDEAITTADNSSYEQYWQPLIASEGSGQLSFCGSLYIGAGLYDGLKDVPKPADIMAEFALISTLK